MADYDTLLPPMTASELAEYELRATMAERDRCAAIVQLAREGEIDGDLRSIISRIRSGLPATVDG